MMPRHLPPLLSLLCLLAAPAPRLAAQADVASPTSEAAAQPVIDFASPDAARFAKPTHDTVKVSTATADAGGLDVALDPASAAYPGVGFAPADGGVFDLSGTGYVEARLTNTGAHVISATLRIDNGGGGGFASGVTYLPPGKSGTARAYYASPGKSSGPVNPASLARLLVFVSKNDKVARTFRIDSIVAGGRPGDQAPTNPDLVRVKPPRGVIFAPAAPFVPGKQLLPRGGAKTGLATGGTTAKTDAGKPVAITFGGGAEESVTFRPVRGFWDLSDFLQVTVRVKNTGAAPAALTARLTSRGGTSDVGVTDSPIAPGATADVVIPFIPRTPLELISDPDQEKLELKKTWGVRDTPGARFFSHQTTGVLLEAADAAAPATFEILAITGGMPALAPSPAWLGQRPPVPGEWEKTFEDNFDGTALNTDVWNTYSENWWDKRVGFSKQNVLLGDGVARLRIEKRAGFHNDDPSGRATEFATGWLDSYGKWTQLYGYFEVRVKLPTAPSMFPAFWMMPERGPADWPKHRRTETKDGGMEIDVFEGQSMWGPWRTTFGAHYDSYGKYHKVTGTSAHYNLPDKDGFLTIGLLWTPGHISVYSQGRKGASWDSPRICSVPSYLIFDLLPGGFEYDPLDPATLPADLVIDYVRVWQRKDLK